MVRKLKLLSLVLAAFFALGALGASAAMAESLLTPGVAPAILEGTQGATQRFTFTGSNASQAVTLKGTTSNLRCTTTTTTVKEATCTPEYAGFTLAGLSVVIRLHKCTYTLTNTATALTWNYDVTNCPTTEPIEIEVPSTGCIITISNQGPLSKVTFANNTATPDYVTASLAVTGITYTGNSKCPPNIIGTFSNGDLGGSYIFKAYEDLNGTKGKQVNLTAD